MFDVIGSSYGATVLGSGLILALLFIDILPYSIKRLNSRVHDTELAVKSSRRLLDLRTEHVKRLAESFNEETRLMSQVIWSKSENQASSGRGTSSESAVTDTMGAESVPPGWRKERFLNFTVLVNRDDAIRTSPWASTYMAKKHDQVYLLKEPSASSHVSAAEQLKAMRNEIEQYKKLNYNPKFPRLQALDEDRGRLLIDFKERLSIDNYLYGYISAASFGQVPALRDVTAEEILVWLRHLLAGARVLWDSGVAFVDGHPSNTVIEGSVDGPVFDCPPVQAGPETAGYLKLVDLGSAMPLYTTARNVTGREAYLPPEYLDDSEPTPSIEGDVYSLLGGVGYFLLTGSDPHFEHRGASSLGPPPLALNSNVPPELSDLVMQFLGVDPVGRLAGARLDSGVEYKFQTISARLDLAQETLSASNQRDQLVLQRGRKPSPASSQNPNPGEPTEEIFQ